MSLGKSLILLSSQDESATVQLPGVLRNWHVPNFTESLLGLLSSTICFNAGSGPPSARLSTWLRGRRGRHKIELGELAWGTRSVLRVDTWEHISACCTLKPLFWGPLAGSPLLWFFFLSLLLIIDSKPSHCSVSFSMTPWKSDRGSQGNTTPTSNPNSPQRATAARSRRACVCPDAQGLSAVLPSTTPAFPLPVLSPSFSAQAPTSYCLPVYTLFLFLSSPNLLNGDADSWKTSKVFSSLAKEWQWHRVDFWGIYKLLSLSFSPHRTSRSQIWFSN